MNKDTFSGQWNEIKGELKKRWGALNDDDLKRAEGDYDKLIGAIQERSGYARERARQEFDESVSGCARRRKRARREPLPLSAGRRRRAADVGHDPGSLRRCE